MKIERQNLANSIVELVVEETVDNIAQYRKEVFKDIEKNAEVKGFRKWAKIPEVVILREYGEDRINHMAIEKAIDNLYRNALREANVLPVAQGEIVEIISESPLKVKIHIEVLPEVTVEDSYKKVSLEKKHATVDDSEVEAALKDIQTRFTTYTEADEAIVMWDRVTISTQGWDKEGKKLENTNMDNYPIIIGSKILVPGFEEGLVGHKKDEEFKLDINFPADYHNPDFAGKETVFDVKTKEANIRMEEEIKLVEELVKHTKLEVGAKLLAHQIDRVFEEIKQNMAQSWIKMADYIESLKLTEAQYKENHVKESALRRLQGELILAKLAELEKIEVSEEEAKTEIDKIISRFGNEEVIARLKELYVPGNRYYEELRQRMIYKKTIDRFYK